MNASRLAAPALGALFLGTLAASPAAAQGQPLTNRSRTAGLEVRAHVQNASPVAPGGFDITVHGPPGATYTLFVDGNLASIDNSFTFPGLIGPLSLATPTVVTLPGNFTVPAGQVLGTIPPSGTQTLTATGSLPLGWSFPLFWQAAIVDFAGVNPLNPAPAVYATNAQTRVPVGPIAAPSVTGFTAGPFVPASNGVVRDVEQADVDGDGDEDTLVIRQNVGTALLYLQNVNTPGQPPAYQPPILLPVPPTSTTAEFADLDQDGFLELIVGSTGTTYLTVFQNLGGTGPLGAWNGYGPGTAILQPGASFNVNDIETADVDGDGLIDVAAATGLAPCVGEPNLLFLNRTAVVGASTLFDVTLTRMPLQFEDTEDMEFFDFDLDGDLDMLMGNFDGPPAIEGQNFIYPNVGGFFNVIAPIPVGTPAETLDVVAEDIDLDGAPDIYDATWLRNAGCGQPFAAIQLDALLLNGPSFGLAPGNFVDISFQLPDNPFYTGATPWGPWAALDAEAPRFPADGVLGGSPVFKDYDHDGDVDILIACGSFGNPNPLVATAAPGINRGIVILNNQQAQTPGAPFLPPFLVDLSLAAVSPGGIGAPADINDIELGDWLIFSPTARWWAQKDIGVGTRTGHFAIKKNQG